MCQSDAAWLPGSAGSQFASDQVAAVNAPQATQAQSRIFSTLPVENADIEPRFAALTVVAVDAGLGGLHVVPDSRQALLALRRRQDVFVDDEALLGEVAAGVGVAHGETRHLGVGVGGQGRGPADGALAVRPGVRVTVGLRGRALGLTAQVGRQLAQQAPPVRHIGEQQWRRPGRQAGVSSVSVCVSLRCGAERGPSACCHFLSAATLI